MCDFLSGISLENISDIAVIIASIAATYGILSWRKERDEFTGKRNIELAEEVLTLFYEAADVISSIRSPFGFGGEGSTRKASENETAEEKEIYDRAYVVIERFERHQDVFNKIRAMRYRFKARFGDEAIKPFDELHAVVNEVLFSSRKLRRHWLQQGKPMNEDRFQKHLEDMEKAEAIFWEGMEDDPIKPRVTKLVETIEGICKKTIEG